jgi:hypothetical protein
MDAVVCTHCQVTMTSWAAPGSPIRYYQCPFCARIHASCYGDTIQRGGAARVVGAQVRPAQPGALPQATDEEIRWAGVKARAARWFARLEAEELHAAARLARPPARQPAPRAEPSAVAVAALGARPARHK